MGRHRVTRCVLCRHTSKRMKEAVKIMAETFGTTRVYCDRCEQWRDVTTTRWMQDTLDGG